MTGDQPFRPHQTGAELVVRLGATADVQTIADGGFPILQVTWGSITLLVMPHAASEGVPITACDVERARDLSAAARVYLDAMEGLWSTQEGAAAAVVVRR